MIIETERLRLRPFEDHDRAPFATINADPQVMRFFPATLTRQESDALIDRIVNKQATEGFCLWAAESRETGSFIGMIGLTRMNDELRAAMNGAPEVEIGWRLARAYWGQGLAPEGALACLDYAWNTLELPEVVAFTYRGNTPSQRVMEKIGMTRDPQGDFEHPQIAEGHPIRPHVLYRINNPGLL